MPFYSSMIDSCVSADACPPEVHVFSDISPFFSDDRPYTFVNCRRTATAQQVCKLIAEYDLPALGYFSEVAVIRKGQDLENAIRNLALLFAKMQSDLRRAAACSFWACSAEEVSDALAMREEAPIPERLCDDEGEGLAYAIAYLKAHMFVLRYAQRNGMYVLHGKSHHLDGTEAE